MWHETCCCMWALHTWPYYQSHAGCEQISTCSRGHFSLVGSHLSHRSVIPYMSLNRCFPQSGLEGTSALVGWADMWVKHCRQGSSLVKLDRVGIRSGLWLAPSPPSRSCHGGSCILLLSFTPIGCKGQGPASGHTAGFCSFYPSSYTMYSKHVIWQATPEQQKKRGKLRLRALSACTLLSGRISLALWFNLECF